MVATVAVGGGPSGLGINTDGSRLYVTNRSDQTLSVINTATNAVISTLSVNGSPVLAVVSPDGTRAYSLNTVYANATLSVINTTTNTVITTITNIAPDASPSSVSVNPTDGRIFIVNANGKIKAINPATNTIEATIDLGNVNTLAYGDFIKSGKLGCSSTPATFTITVNPRLTPTVAIAVTSGSQNMCEGAVSSVTFTATPTYGGTTPQYQWKKNGNDVGMNSNTYTDAALAQGDIITCVLTSNADYLTTPTATSNSITIAVTPIPSINAVSNQTVCVGTATTAVAFSGTGATSYTWTNNNTAIGLAASGTGNIGAFTATNSTTSAITATITVTPKAGAANCAGTPTTFTITVNPNPAVYAITGGGTSCDGSGVAVGLSNSESGVNYQLKRGGVNTGSPVAGTGSAISFGNQTTTGIYTATAVNATTNCVINMTGSANVENNATTLTPSVAITANPSGAIYTITSVTFTATPTTGGTTPQYQWQKNGANVGSNSPTYTNNSWANGDVVTCILTSNHPCAAPTTATSNSITISATVPPAGAALNFDGADDYVDCGNAANLQLSTGTIEGWIKTSGAGTGYRGIIVKQLAYSLFLVDNVLGLYNWGGGAAVTTNVNLADNQWHHVALSFQNGVTNGSVIYIDGTARTTFTLNISSQSVGLAIGAGQPGVSQNFNGTIDEVRVWNTVRTASEIANSRSCELMGNETGLVSYYKFNQGVAELTNTGVTTLTDATTNANNGTLTNFALTGATSNWVSSSNSIGAPVTPSVSIAASPSGTITAGTSVTFTATPTNGGAAPTYVWKKGGIAISGEVSATYTSSTLANGDIITCEMTSNAACATTALATSTGITMSVTAASTYTWTGETSTDWATATNWNPNGIPGSTDNVIIPTTANKPMLPANQTIANLSLTGTNKIMLGNSTLCVNAITGGSNLSYVVTDGTGGLIIKALRTNAVTTFAIGASETSYDPVAIQPTNSVDFTVKVKATANAAGFSGTIANFNKVVPRQWDVTPTGTAGSTVLAVLPSVTYVPTTPKLGHYTGTDWEELSAQYSAGSNAWLATTNSFSPFGVGDAGGFVAVLSVEWLSFTGYNKSGVNVLNWATANEVNNKGFQVERLNAQGNVWDILGFVNAKGKGSSYDFTDNTPLSTSYYRLRQLDNDGKETYSKVISISSKGSDKLKIYPNPVSDLLIVETDMKDDYEILNLLGQQVLTGKTLPSGAKGLDVSALPQGTYFLKVGAEQVKFMKQ